jgi:glycosyltransferase involved in cell wall biosynthesis
MLRRYLLVYEAVLTPPSENGRNVRLKMNWVFDRFAAIHSDVVVSNSTSSERILKRFSKYVVTIPNFVFTGKILTKRADIRRKYNLDESAFVVGIVGPFDNPYNSDLIPFVERNIDLFAKRNIYVMIIGDGTSKFTLQHDQLVRVGFVNDYWSHLAALDLLAIPRTRRTDGAMNRAVEAMSIGLPVITSWEGLQMMEYCTPGKDIIVTTNDEMANVICDIANDRQWLASLSAESINTYQLKYEVGKERVKAVFNNSITVT